MSKPDYSGTYHMVEQHNMDAYLEGLGEATLDFTTSLVPEHATEPPSPGPVSRPLNLLKKVVML